MQFIIYIQQLQLPLLSPPNIRQVKCVLKSATPLLLNQVVSKATTW